MDITFELPGKSEAIFCQLSPDELEFKMWCNVRPEDMTLHRRLLQRFLFVGKVKENSFEIRKRNLIHYSLSPLIKAKIEGSEKGSLLFLEYHMSPVFLKAILYACIIALVFGYMYITFKTWLFAFTWFTFVMGIGYLVLVALYKSQLYFSGKLIRKMIS